MISDDTNLHAISKSFPLVINESLRLIKDLDMTSNKLSKELDRKIRKHKKSGAKSISSKIIKKRKLADIIIDNKTRLAMGAYDLIDKHVRLIDEELNALDAAIYSCTGDSAVVASGINVPAGQPTEASIPVASFGIKTGANEPLFCICRTIAHGEMIACDNEDCLIEWFHFPCVGLTKLPRKGTNWYCPDCISSMKRSSSKA